MPFFYIFLGGGAVAPYAAVHPEAEGEGDCFAVVLDCYVVSKVGELESAVDTGQDLVALAVDAEVERFNFALTVE